MVTALDQVTKDTVDAIQKAQTAGIGAGTGLYGVDLAPYVSLVPEIHRFRDTLPRVTPTDGAKFALWRAIMNVNNAQPNLAVGFDFAGGLVQISEQDFQAQYKPLAAGNSVTQDAIYLAKGLGVDPLALSVFQTLAQALNGEDKILAGGQSFALPIPAAPTLTQVATGGTIGAVTGYVAVAPRTGENYSYGGNGRGASASTTFASGTTNSIVASIAAVKGAVAYDWFYSANGTTWYYYTTTTVASVTITKVISANQTIPNLADISAVVPTLSLTADNGSADANAPDGFIATLTGDYTSTGAFTTAGAANANGATFIDGGGAALGFTGNTVTQFDTVFNALWATAKLSPSAIMLNATTLQEVTHLILSSSAANLYLQPDRESHLNITAGGQVSSVINPITGEAVPLEVHTSVPAGTALFRTDRVPWPQSNITNTLEVRTQLDWTEYDYGSSRIAATAGGGPRKDFEVRSIEAFVNRAPAAMGILTNIA